MAQIINRKSDAIISGARAIGYPFISVQMKGLHFTKETAFMCDLKEDKFVHFINDTNYWAFYVNTDDDGFRISSDHQDGGYVLYSRQLSRLFKNSVGAKDKDRFFINETNSVHNGCKVYEIQTTASVEVIIQKAKLMTAQRKKEINYVLNLKHKSYKKRK